MLKSLLAALRMWWNSRRPIQPVDDSRRGDVDLWKLPPGAN